MQKTFEVQGPVELDVRLASGDIDVDPNTEGRVEIELIAHDEESQRLVDNARIELNPHGNRSTVLVDVPQKKGFSISIFGRSGIECRIRCPHESGLSVRTKSADVSARGVLGGLNVQTASGDIDLSVAHGPVNVTSVSGDISIGEAYDNVNANSVSGDQDHGAVMQGVVAAHSVSGDVTIAVRRGSKAFLDCTTVSGDTTSELELSSDAPAGNGPLVEIRAKTVSGDIRITRAPAPADTQEVHA
jgi:DUF4097 and DUF4098 domain-containing protein YvlB